MTEPRASQVRRVMLEPAAGVSFFVLVPADADEVLEAAIRDDTVDPYAHTLWPAGLAAAAAVLRFLRAGGASRARTVVDVGAGCGVVSLAAATMGASAIALDHDCSALRRVEDAAALQGLRVDTAQFDIHGPAPLPRCDVAVFSDLLYQPALARAAAIRVAEAVAAGAHVIVSDPGRAGRDVFISTLAGLGYGDAFHPVSVTVPDDAAAAIGMLELSGSQSA